MASINDITVKIILDLSPEDRAALDTLQWLRDNTPLALRVPSVFSGLGFDINPDIRERLLGIKPTFLPENNKETKQ